MRALIITFFTFSAVSWMIFAFIYSMDFAIADSIGSPELRFSKRAEMAGGCLFVLSLISVWMPTGLFGRNRLLVVVTFVLGVSWLAVTPYLYPDLAVFQYPFRLAAHILGFLALLVGVTKTYLPRSSV